ncbi:MAG: elongation factor P [Gammaproteobacteria bacterium (ex Lamellibrachia satsuma)]|nr:MAG: elongation factor P-like protein YeiP [Gammaproteobacteria bacterium (ex Lamellibrachia satsuma)]RRS32114.1 MAG: elongation factor P [Gammaproteobacteria bacterium (ex Lamellibrachia satsuma)]RRS34291.1 MAG: elongation factor P [Gammaproteobacteria bacterium (ex Lamellibrachia satsuma)]
MPKACDLKRGIIVEINGMPHSVKQVEAKSPSSRGAATLYKIRFINLQTGQKLDESFKGDDFLKDIDCLRRQVQFSYMDGEIFTFMDTEDYSQYGLNSEDLEGQTGFLIEGLDGIIALLVDGAIIGIELPQSVALTISETTPGIKGSTATGRTKPAMLNTGIEIQVPEYLENGEVVKVNTTTGKFISRA